MGVAPMACVLSIDSAVRMRVLAVLGAALLVACSHRLLPFIQTGQDLLWGE